MYLVNFVDGCPDNSLSVIHVCSFLDMSVHICFAAEKHCHHTMLIDFDAFTHLRHGRTYIICFCFYLHIVSGRAMLTLMAKNSVMVNSLKSRHYIFVNLLLLQVKNI
jgi:hypothetical protein